MIPLSVPNIRGNEWKYVKECLDTEWVSTAGTYVKKFEAQMAGFTGARHAVACVNGTAALHIALILAGVQPGDEVIVPTVTFIAPINAVRYVNAVPIFMDCDGYYNLDEGKTVDFLRNHTVFRQDSTYNRTTGRRIAAIIPVHVFGNALRLDVLTGECAGRGIRMVEDASESLGTVYSEGKFIGKHTGTIGDMGCLSFNGNKILTTGGGGMILTDSDALAEKARYLTTQAKDDEIRYIHNEVGYNYRLTNVQAAVGVAQLEQLPGFLEIKERNYFAYKKEIEHISGLRLADVPLYAHNNHWMYCLQIDSDSYGKGREELMRHLSDHHIQTRPVWQLNHLQVPYVGCQRFRIELAPQLHAATLNIPCSANLTENQMREVLDRLKR
jgi:perosamine synthetase